MDGVCMQEFLEAARTVGTPAAGILSRSLSRRRKPTETSSRAHLMITQGTTSLEGRLNTIILAGASERAQPLTRSTATAPSRGPATPAEI